MKISKTKKKHIIRDFLKSIEQVCIGDIDHGVEGEDPLVQIQGVLDEMSAAGQKTGLKTAHIPYCPHCKGPGRPSPDNVIPLH